MLVVSLVIGYERQMEESVIFFLYAPVFHWCCRTPLKSGNNNGGKKTSRLPTTIRFQLCARFFTFFHRKESIIYIKR